MIFEKFLQNKENKIKIITFQIILIILILISNLLFRKNTESNKSNSISDITTIDSGIDAIFENYGIQKDWQKKQSVKTGDSFIRYERIVSIPSNIPIVNINYEIKALCDKYNAKATSTENLKNQILLVHIKYANNIIQTIRFITDSDIIRFKSKYCILSYGFEKLSEFDQALLLHSEYFKSFIIDYNLKDERRINRFKKYNKEIFLILNINTTDYKNFLNSNDDSTTIRKMMKDLLRNFNEVDGMVINQANEIKNQKYLEELLSRINKIMLIKSKLFQLEETEKGFKNLDDIMFSNKDKPISICNIRNNNLKKISDILEIYNKKGSKLIKVKDLIKQELVENEAK